MDGLLERNCVLLSAAQLSDKTPSPPRQAERGAPSALRSPLSPGLIFTHIFGWTRGVELLMPYRAPKGRTSKAQANGLGPRTPFPLAASPERAK